MLIVTIRLLSEQCGVSFDAENSRLYVRRFWKSIDIDVYRNDYLCNVNNIVCNYKTTGLRLSSSIVNIHKDYIMTETLALSINNEAGLEDTYDLNGHKTGIKVVKNNK